MQLVLIIALLSLFSGSAYAQKFPSGSDNVEINLDVLKPMEEGYEPPDMFGAPLTNFEEEAKEEKAPAKIAKPQALKPSYFNPPPIPPKRPQSFNVSEDYIRSLQTKQNSSKSKPATIQDKNLTERIDAQIIDNEIDADVIHMSAQNVLNSIEGNDLTEEIIEDNDEEPPTGHPVVTSDFKSGTQSLTFKIDSVELEQEAKDFLVNNIVPVLKYNTKTRLEIQAYASPNIEEKNSRRTSLTRALNIRKFLETHEISKKRVSIRALGDQTDTSPADRADLLILPQ